MLDSSPPTPCRTIIQVSLANAVPGCQGWANRSITHTFTLAAVHAQHIANHVRHLANIAAAFTPTAGRGDEQVLNWSACR
jgi:hypothetical protein